MAGEKVDYELMCITQADMNKFNCNTEIAVYSKEDALCVAKSDRQNCDIFSEEDGCTQCSQDTHTNFDGKCVKVHTITEACGAVLPDGQVNHLYHHGECLVTCPENSHEAPLDFEGLHDFFMHEHMWADLPSPAFNLLAANFDMRGCRKCTCFNTS
jgi:hypothetical protein